MYEQTSGVEAPTAEAAAAPTAEAEGGQGSFSSRGALPPASRGFGEQAPSPSDRAYGDAEPTAHQSAMLTTQLEVHMGGRKVMLQEGTVVNVLAENGGTAHVKVFSGHNGALAFIPMANLHVEPALSKVGTKEDDRYMEYQGALWHGQPKAADVGQGRAGDCWLISSAAAIAETNPADIMKLFAPHTPNQTKYKVTLHKQVGKKLEPVTVEVDTELASEKIPKSQKDRPTYDGLNRIETGSRNTPMWPMLLEKAVAEMDGMSSSAGYNDVDVPAWPASAMEAITGKSASNSADGAPVGHTGLEESAKLQAMLDRGEAVCCGTQKLTKANEKWFKQWNFVDSHAYYLKAIEGDMLVFGNPWGYDEPHKIPKAWFWAVFGEISGVTVGHEQKPEPKHHDHNDDNGQVHGGGGG